MKKQFFDYHTKINGVKRFLLSALQLYFFLQLVLFSFSSCDLLNSGSEKKPYTDYCYNIFQIENQLSSSVRVTVSPIVSNIQLNPYLTGYYRDTEILSKNTIEFDSLSAIDFNDIDYQSYLNTEEVYVSFKMEIILPDDTIFIAVGWPNVITSDSSPKAFGILYSVVDGVVFSDLDYSEFNSQLLPSGMKFNKDIPKIKVLITDTGEIQFSLIISNIS